MVLNLTKYFLELTKKLAKNRLTFLVFLMVALSGCENILSIAPMSTINPVTQVGRDINKVYALTTIVCVFIFLCVSIPVCIALWKYRERPGDEDFIPEEISHGTAKILEITWTVVPVILLILIAVPTWTTIFKHAKKPNDPELLTVVVNGHQWWWEFKYIMPGDHDKPGNEKFSIVTANELHLPPETNIELIIESKDVLHSYWVPRFGGKMDAVPGHKNKMYFKSPPASGKKGGDYYQGQCAELCGLSHALMRFESVVHTSQEWDRWVQAYNEPPVVETRLEKRGEELFAGCISCHDISGALHQYPADPETRAIQGPNLNNFGSRRKMMAGIRDNTKENLKLWITNSSKFKPGSKMMSFEFSDEDLDAIAAYIRNSTYKKL